MQKQCSKCNLNFEITDNDLEFYKKVSPVFDGKTYEIPTPTLCPECRQQRRLSFRNERQLYKRKCDATGESIVSIYSPDKPFPVFEREYWFTDGYNPTSYGKDFDFSIPFFKQFKELIDMVPKFSIQQQPPMENSVYCNYASNCKDSYFLFDSDYNEKSLYSNVLKHSNYCIDCSVTSNSEACYQSVDLKECFELFYSNNCINCSQSYFLKNSIASNNCFACINIQNGSYYIFNKKYEKEEYETEVRRLLKDKNILEKVNKFYFENIHKSIFNYLGENVSGDHINDSKNVFESFDVSNGENLKFCDFIYSGKNLYDVSSFGEHISEVYDSTTVGINSSKIYFSAGVAVNSNDIYYSYIAFPNVKNCFGCTGMKNKQYCILNKQYTKDEYNTLVPKIIEHMKTTGEWGEFFPSSISQFGYNETVANEYFPLKKEEILEQGFNYSDYEAPFPKVDKIIPASKLPENITDIPDDILNWAIECEVSKKPFRIISQELEFYRKHNLPVPRKHPDVRHEERMKLRNPRKLFDRKCDKCEIKMKTTYSPDREEIVYCEECYVKEVY